MDTQQQPPTTAGREGRKPAALSYTLCPICLSRSLYTTVVYYSRPLSAVLSTTPCICPTPAPLPIITLLLSRQTWFARDCSARNYVAATNHEARALVVDVDLMTRVVSVRCYWNLLLHPAQGSGLASSSRGQKSRHGRTGRGKTEKRQRQAEKTATVESAPPAADATPKPAVYANRFRTRRPMSPGTQTQHTTRVVLYELVS